ncbi:hypothetical protein GGR50DRAFT_696688 [Xylaria sp. CBS 124048]|nr:hypothetical protein GGR50DRAFT_696688 [Xylaria sp. CBS 124048]
MVPSKKRPAETDDASGPATKKHRKGFRVGPENLPDGPWRRKVDKIKKELIHKAKVKKAYKKVKAAELATPSSSSVPSKAAAAPDANGGSVTIVKINTKEVENSDNDENNEKLVEEDENALEPPTTQIHPERQAMLGDDDDDGGDGETTENTRRGAKRGDQDSEKTQDREGGQREQQRRGPRQKKPGYFDKALTVAERKKAEAAERAAEQARRDAERQRKNEERERFRRAMAKARKPGRDGQRRLGRESGLLLEKVKKMVG